MIFLTIFKYIATFTEKSLGFTEKQINFASNFEFSSILL